MTETTRATTLNALADRCEAASGADIYLDAAIRDALALGHDYSVDWRGWGFDENGKGIEKPKAFPYTASIDAATSLFPGQTMYRSGHSATGADPSMFFCDAVTDAPLCIDVHALAATEPLARAAAALRALAHLSQENNDVG
jgi:hypothetical protein